MGDIEERRPRFLLQKLAEQTHAVTIVAKQAADEGEVAGCQAEGRRGRREVEDLGREGGIGEGGKAVSAERKKWQAKGKALPVETVTIATQTDHNQEPKAIQVHDDGTQTEVVVEEFEKGRAKVSEDTVKKDRSENCDGHREMHQDLSGYEDEEESLVAEHPATKKQAALSRPAKTPPRSTSPYDNGRQHRQGERGFRRDYKLGKKKKEELEEEIENPRSQIALPPPPLPPKPPTSRVDTQIIATSPPPPPKVCHIDTQTSTRTYAEAATRAPSSKGKEKELSPSSYSPQCPPPPPPLPYINIGTQTLWWTTPPKRANQVATRAPKAMPSPGSKRPAAPPPPPRSERK